MAERVEIFEVGPRDGLQNEARMIATDAKVALVDLLSGAGFRRIEITVQQLGFRRRSTAFAAFLDPYHADMGSERKGQHMARPDLEMRLRHRLAVDPDMARGNELRRQRAALEEAREPEPLVDPDGLGDVGHLPITPCRTAKGEDEAAWSRRAGCFLRRSGFGRPSARGVEA